MTEKEYKDELEKYENTQNFIDYMDNENFKKLFLKYNSVGMDNFVLSEAILILANSHDNMEKLSALELLRKLDY